MYFTCTELLIVATDSTYIENTKIDFLHWQLEIWRCGCVGGRGGGVVEY